MTPVKGSQSTIGKKLKLEGKKHKRIVRDSVAIIDSIHRDGPLPVLPVRIIAKDRLFKAKGWLL